MWLRYLYGELGFIQQEPILLLGDNDGSIAMAKNPQFHKRTKHVDIRWHWVRELVDCRDPQQTADILTKQVPRVKFITWREDDAVTCKLTEARLYIVHTVNNRKYNFSV